MKKKNNKQKRISPSIRRFYPMLIVVICLFMSIGYATVNSNRLTVAGDIIAMEQEGVVILEATYKEDVNANLVHSEMKATSGTLLNSSIVLSETDPNSYITYTLIIYNGNSYDCTFRGATFDSEFYDNESIIYELSDNITTDTVLVSGEYISFDITFKYKDGVTPSSTTNILNSYINFAFNSIAIVPSVDIENKIAFWGQQYREKIKNINFENKIAISDLAIKSWDIGLSQNGDVMAFIVANKEDSTYYDLYIQSDTQLYANEDMSNWFANFENIDSINGLELLDTSKTINMKRMFNYTGANSPIFTLDVSNFDTSKVTDMQYMFCNTGKNSTLFTLDVSNFDTRNVTNMSRMFYYTGYLSTIFTLNLSNFDTSKVTDMAKMFHHTGATSTNFTLDLSGFNTSNVTTMLEMFDGAGMDNKNFALNVSSFDTSKVTDMSSMFYNAGRTSENFTLDVSNFDTGNVTTMKNMFYYTGYSNPNFTLDVSNFDTSNVTDMYGMFYRTGYTSTTFNIDISHFDTSKVTDMYRMFYNTGYNSSKLNTSITIKNPNTTSYDGMFLSVATKTGSKITVNYTSATSSLVDQMIATKSSTSNVVKGVQVD